MLRVVVTGGPGVGKTTVLRELEAMGYAVVAESAREIIRERLAQGLPPRPEPQEFAAERIRRDQEKLQRANAPKVFFDRCLVESIGMARESGLLAESEAKAMLGGLPFHPRVFVLPPWREIYVNDAERDHTFEHCQRVHRALAEWYAACGYQVCEVPRTDPRRRAEFILGELRVP
ncbi:MAG: AAA family ATPase [Nitrospirae bacterium]|nr:AAA family ATPase [Fimbriimonadaceae bacterium]